MKSIATQRFLFGAITLLAIISLSMNCKNSKTLETVPAVDLEKYMGRWYEIARLPNSFEEGLKCVTAEYQLKENGRIKVINSGTQIENPDVRNQSVGIAKMPNAAEPGKLKVSFFRPFWGKYQIMQLDSNYQYTLIGTPSRKYLWILARTPQLDDNTKAMLVSYAKDKGFKTESLIFTKQDCDL
jgi:apolipoprotein D and lipocalin family protein